MLVLNKISESESESDHSAWNMSGGITLLIKFLSFCTTCPNIQRTFHLFNILFNIDLFCIKNNLCFSVLHCQFTDALCNSIRCYVTLGSV